ncbi:MAG: hypothetical protein KatS3mg003_1741 [Candidatus Nitrosocaldaceae archaeon]|nr:MAG: hypothetical protein KatS3mg003_1741 [Candidatus Nitrosocaldaceae archaeon]
MIKVRAELSKNNKPYVTFLSTARSKISINIP